MKILVADDEVVSRLMLEHVLSEMGHEVVCVNDGDQAWEELSSSPGFRMALLDWMMPGKSGIQVAEKVKKVLSRNERFVYVIMISQRDSTEDLVEAMNAGADDYVAKPVDLSEVRVRINAGIRLIDLHDQLIAGKTLQEQMNEELRQARDELEDRVNERTAELAEVNRRLRASEETFRAVFESAEDWMFVKDKDLRFTHVNPAFLMAYGLKRAQVIAKTRDECFPNGAEKQLEEVDNRVLAGRTIKHQFRTVVNDRPVVAEFVRVPLRDESGRVVGMCGIGRDVTDRVRASSEHQLDDPQTSLAYPSRAIRTTLARIDLAAHSDSVVLLLGESGAGKDFLARHLHEHSRRASGPFFELNCAALPEGIAESELFGHEKGAYTGTDGTKRGLLELAEGGTLLLNEIAELPLPVQAKLLTFLDNRRFTRLGGTEQLSVNARIVAATNRDLRKEVDEGRFRRDLFFRLDVFTVQVPPLRDRIDDLPVLVNEILPKLARQMGMHRAPEVHGSAMYALAEYHWPGNVRELRNILERALILSRGDEIKLEHVETSSGAGMNSLYSGTQFSTKLSESICLEDALDRVRRSLITEALRRSGNNVKEAAANLGISRTTLYKHLDHFGIRK